MKPIFLYIPILCCFVTSVANAQLKPDPTVKRPDAQPAALPAAYTGSSGNYVRVWEPAVPTEDASYLTSGSRTTAEVKESSQYFDGLGRLQQTVGKGMSSNGKDMVTPAVYDAYGRQIYQYLPYESTQKDGKFKLSPFTEQQTFYQQLPGISEEKIYYSQTDYESSPMNRVMSNYAPGNSWSKNNGNHPVSSKYQVNTVADKVVVWSIDAGLYPVSTGEYAPGSLYKSITIDEQGKQTVEFKDVEGHVLLKKVQLDDDVSVSPYTGWLSTYYVYDDMGLLRFVIPPLAVEKMVSNWNVAPLAENLCFIYRYDGRGRMIMKKVPGADSLEMVYDIRDRLAFTRDGNQRLANQWLVTFYDNLNRPVEKALYASAASRAMLQQSMDNATGTNIIEYRFPGANDLVTANFDKNEYVARNTVTLADGFETPDGATVDIYINPTLEIGSSVLTVTNPLPSIAAADLTPLLFTYYDKYNFSDAKPSSDADFNKPQAGQNPYAEAISKSTNVTALQTGSRSRVLGTDTWLTSTTYYDVKNRPIQVISDNYAGGQDVLTTLYDFNGKVLSTYQRHKNPRSSQQPMTTVLTMMNYDATGRPTDVIKQFNDQPALTRTVSHVTYDALGRMQSKQLGINGTAAPIETLDYQYNIRGWLQSINKNYLDGATGAAHFGQALSYDEGFSRPAYNGNIAGIRWKGWNDPVVRAYGYKYDNANRLTGADFTQDLNNNNTWSRSVMDFTVDKLSYDANGNIRSMAQKGMDGGTIVSLDDLTYTYESAGNKLLKVNDASSVVSKLGDFKNGQNPAASYSYDPMGNLQSDPNKGIDKIRYNYLNLPEQITIPGKGIIKYFYDVAGQKLQKRVIDSTGTQVKEVVTDYINGFVYEQDTLQFAAHEEGRLRVINKAGQAPSYAYDYFIKDHLGNTRLVMTEQTDLNVYAATMESAVAAKETALFSNVSETRVSKPVGYPTDESAGKNEFVSKLNANGSKSKIGPSLVLRVMAGDTLQIGARAFYKSTGPKENARDANPENMLTDLIHAFGGEKSSGGHGGSIAQNNTPFNGNFYNNDYRRLKEKANDGNMDNKPHAYLNFVLFDDQFKLVEDNSGVKQVQAVPDELQTLSQDKMIASRSGFLYVYTSNESPQDVYFDNLVVTHATGPVIEETHYYPFGLTMAGISSNALVGTRYPENRNKFGSKELNNNEFADGNGLDLYDFTARNYDPQVGRWLSGDPLADKYQNFSPYVYVANNPIKYLDPDGKLIRDKDGNIVVTTTGQQVTVSLMQSTDVTKNADGTQSASFISRTYEVVTMFADNGTPIEAMRLVSAVQVDAVFDENGKVISTKPGIIDGAKNDCVADCHGYTFTENKLWVNDDQVNTILENDNVYECGVPESLADIVVFKTSEKVVHSARRNKDGTYNNNAGFLTTEYNVSLESASRGLTDVSDKKNTEFARRRRAERTVDTSLGTVGENGIRTITDPDEIKKFLKQLTH